jgi:hypothetical protein
MNFSKSYRWLIVFVLIECRFVIYWLYFCVRTYHKTIERIVFFCLFSLCYNNSYLWIVFVVGCGHVWIFFLKCGYAWNCELFRRCIKPHFSYLSYLNFFSLFRGCINRTLLELSQSSSGDVVWCVVAPSSSSSVASCIGSPFLMWIQFARLV